MFELESLTKVRCLDVRVLSKKDRKPDENPGAQLLLQATLGAGVLALFDGYLPGMLYRKSTTKKQGELDGLDTAELTSVGEHVKRIPWDYEQTGCEITIDFGLGGKSNVVLADCKVNAFALEPHEGGTVTVSLRVQSQIGLTEKILGKLATLVQHDVQLMLTAPETSDQAPLVDAERQRQKTPEEALAESAG